MRFKHFQGPAFKIWDNGQVQEKKDVFLRQMRCKHFWTEFKGTSFVSFREQSQGVCIGMKKVSFRYFSSSCLHCIVGHYDKMAIWFDIFSGQYDWIGWHCKSFSEGLCLLQSFTSALFALLTTLCCTRTRRGDLNRKKRNILEKIQKLKKKHPWKNTPIKYTAPAQHIYPPPSLILAINNSLIMHNWSFSWNALSFYSRIQVFMFLNWKKYFHVFSQHHSDICEKILVVPLLPNFLSSTNQMLLARVSWPVHISQEILSICLSLAVN